MGFFKQNVPVDPNGELVACRNLYGWLHVQVLASDLGSELAHFSSRRTFRVLRCARVNKNALLPVLGHGERRVKHAGQYRKPKELLIVMVNFVAETGITLRIETVHPVQIDRRGVGEDDPVPGDLQAVLAVAHS